MDYVKEQMTRMLLLWLPIEPAHVALVSSLPWHHRDPFDRLLIAQASAEDLTILSVDRALKGYGVSLIG
jgi:PIN domain nuclease of toxin-antitoxin system